MPCQPSGSRAKIEAADEEGTSSAGQLQRLGTAAVTVDVHGSAILLCLNSPAWRRSCGNSGQPACATTLSRAAPVPLQTSAGSAMTLPGTWLARARTCPAHAPSPPAPCAPLVGTILATCRSLACQHVWTPSMHFQGLTAIACHELSNLTACCRHPMPLRVAPQRGPAAAGAAGSRCSRGACATWLRCRGKHSPCWGDG